MKVIFLDLDGVLNCEQTTIDRKRKIKNHEPLGIYYQIQAQGRNGIFLEIDEEKVKILSEIVQISGAKIVLSSTHRSDWRDGPENFWFSKSKALLYLFNKYNIEVVGITPYLDNPLGAPREEEIKTYLFQHPEVESFCIFDDDIKDLQTLKEYLIKTEFYANEIDEGGLQERHVDEAVKLLSKKSTVFNKQL